MAKEEEMSNVPNCDNNTPKLRFPGFEGGWEFKKLGSVSPLQRGFDLPIDRIQQGIYPVVFSNGISKYHNEFKVKGPGVVTGRSGTIGKVTFVNEDYWPHNTSLWVTDFKDNSPRFIYYFYSKFKLERFGTGSGVPTLNRNDIHDQSDYFPTLVEQEKIAGFLTIVDERIQTQSKIIKQLETSIASLREELLSQEARFKDGNDNYFPDWEMKTLDDVAIKRSSNISANKIEENFGEYIIYGASSVLKYVDFYQEENDYISIIKDGAGVGRLLYCKGKSSVLATMEIIRPANDINTYFLFCLLANIDFTKYVTGSTIPHIYFKDYKNESVYIPCLAEQIYIANFLRAIDEKIEVEKQFLQQCENQKKHLLKNLFI